MEAFKKHRGIVAPLDRPNVDTDAIIPKQYLKSIKRTGFGPNLFDDWRYLEPGIMGQDHSQRKLNPDFVLNQERFANASILLARDNYGCGSSREHAVWAMMEAGFRIVIAPSFADIFFNNTAKNGLLAVCLPNAVVEQLFQNVAQTPGYQLEVDLPQQTLSDTKDTWEFEIDPSTKQRLLEGLDEIGLSLQKSDQIRAFENERKQKAPWIFQDNSER